MLGDWRAAAGEVGFWPECGHLARPTLGWKSQTGRPEGKRFAFHTRSMGTARPGASALAGQHLPQHVSTVPIRLMFNAKHTRSHSPRTFAKPRRLAESHESSHRFSRKVATRSHQSSHPFGAAGFGATEGAVLPLGFSRLVRGGCDGTGKVGDEKGEEDSCVSFRRGPQRPRDRDPLRSCAALGGADPGAVRRLRADGEGTIPKLYRDLGRIELLILDDWGLAPIDTARARDLGAIVKSCVWVCHAAARSWRSPFTNLTPRMISAN